MQTIQNITKLYPDIEINDMGGPDTYREGLPVVERDPVAVIIKHPSENAYLIAKCNEVLVKIEKLTLVSLGPKQKPPAGY